MPWTLDMHIFDVGAGDSSLIIAGNATNNGTTMLVDAGLNLCARTVHNNVTGLVARLDTILVTHYDQDHSNGVISLLAADNMSVLCENIADKGLAADLAGTRVELIAALAARFAAVALGAVDDEADDPGEEASARSKPAMTDAEAASFGVATAQLVAGDFTGPRLIPPDTTRKNATMAAAVATVNAVEADHGDDMIRATARTALFQVLSSNLPAGAGFQTGGFYKNCRVVDVGTATKPAQAYLNAVYGIAKISDKTAPAPGVNRQRISIPALGSELLWSNAPPDAAAPVAIVVSTPLAGVAAATGSVWQGPNQPATFGGDTSSNRVSIGFVLLFGDSSYYSAGDLPSTGEDLLAPALVGYPLPDGHGGHRAHPLPTVLCVKCSHHGSASATSQSFISHVEPSFAMISCGDRYEAPAQEVITDLYMNQQTAEIWLTNCQYERNGVPFSKVPPQDQRANPYNRAYVAGDNDPNNLAAGRHRGDIEVSFAQATVTGAVGNRLLSVEYWEPCLAPPGTFVNTITW